MSGYVKRDLVVEVTSEVTNNVNCPVDIANSVEQAIMKIPEEDVVKVVYGEWIGRNGTGKYDDFYCSHCSVYESNTMNRDRLGKYCPNCGAKMVGKRC